MGRRPRTARRATDGRIFPCQQVPPRRSSGPLRSACERRRRLVGRRPGTGPSPRHSPGPCSDRQLAPRRPRPASRHSFHIPRPPHLPAAPHRRLGFDRRRPPSTWTRERRNSRAIAAGLRPDSNGASTSRSCPGVTGSRPPARSRFRRLAVRTTAPAGLGRDRVPQPVQLRVVEMAPPGPDRREALRYRPPGVRGRISAGTPSRPGSHPAGPCPRIAPSFVHPLSECGECPPGMAPFRRLRATSRRLATASGGRAMAFT